MSKRLRIVLKATALVAVFALAFSLAKLAPESAALQNLVQNYGYFGIFFVALVSGFNLAVPVPAVAFLPLFIESGLSFWPIIFVLLFGVTLADGLAYLLARAGKHLASESFGERAFASLEKWRERYSRSPLVILFIFASFIPFPNEALLIPLVFLGYRFRELIPIVLVGNFIFSVLYARGIIGFFNIL